MEKRGRAFLPLRTPFPSGPPEVVQKNKGEKRGPVTQINRGLFILPEEKKGSLRPARIVCEARGGGERDESKAWSRQGGRGGAGMFAPVCWRRTRGASVSRKMPSLAGSLCGPTQRQGRRLETKKRTRRSRTDAKDPRVLTKKKGWSALLTLSKKGALRLPRAQAQ